MTAEHLMLMGGLTAFILTLWWVRRRHLREKYAIGWILAATVTLLCGLFPDLLMTFANRAHLSYPSAALFLALAVMYAYAFSVSVSLSRRQRREVTIAQEFALLEQRLRDVEAVLAAYQKESAQQAKGNCGPATAGSFAPPERAEFDRNGVRAAANGRGMASPDVCTRAAP